MATNLAAGAKTDSDRKGEKEKESGIDEGDRRRKRKRRRDLGDDIRRHQVFKPRKAIAQNKLPLLQALNLELIGGANVLEGVDGGIQIAMLLPQHLYLYENLGQFGLADTPRHSVRL
jgi:hypothetical protein